MSGSGPPAHLAAVKVRRGVGRHASLAHGSPHGIRGGRFFLFARRLLRSPACRHRLGALLFHLSRLLKCRKLLLLRGSQARLVFVQLPVGQDGPPPGPGVRRPLLIPAYAVQLRLLNEGGSPVALPEFVHVGLDLPRQQNTLLLLPPGQGRLFPRMLLLGIAFRLLLDPGAKRAGELTFLLAHLLQPLLPAGVQVLLAQVPLLAAGQRGRSADGGGHHVGWWWELRCVRRRCPPRAQPLDGRPRRRRRESEHGWRGQGRGTIGGSVQGFPPSPSGHGEAPWHNSEHVDAWEACALSTLTIRMPVRRNVWRAIAIDCAVAKAKFEKLDETVTSNRSDTPAASRASLAKVVTYWKTPDGTHQNMNAAHTAAAKGSAGLPSESQAVLCHQCGRRLLRSAAGG